MLGGSHFCFLEVSILVHKMSFKNLIGSFCLISLVENQAIFKNPIKNNHYVSTKTNFQTSFHFKRV